jgi:CheY-like chemotaxis protein
MRVLVVDDNVLIRKMVRAVLEEEGLECHEASDVASALSALRTLNPEVCLLDQNLPDGEGLAVLRSVQQWGAHCTGRFYLLTGSEDPDIATKALQVGARGVLLKPVKPEQILRKVRER